MVKVEIMLEEASIEKMVVAFTDAFKTIIEDYFSQKQRDDRE